MQVGNYTLIRLIARGGMADLFLAQLTTSPKVHRVVIKRITKEIMDDPEAQALFLDEIALHQRLLHPNVVQVFDVIEDKGAYYLVLEYVAGTNLQAFLPQLASCPFEQRAVISLLIMLDILKALHFAHGLVDSEGNSLGLVHRDISPANILVAEHCAKLCDFGLAKTRLRLTVTQNGIARGKLRYMSPEQIEDGICDQRSDLFSLGICLYEALTGQKLFSGIPDLEVARMISRNKIRIELPSSSLLQLDLKNLLLRALTPKPSERFQNARAFHMALSSLFFKHFGSTENHFLSDHLQFAGGDELQIRPLSPASERQTEKETPAFHPLKSLSSLLRKKSPVDVTH